MAKFLVDPDSKTFHEQGQEQTVIQAKNLKEAKEKVSKWYGGWKVSPLRTSKKYWKWNEMGITSETGKTSLFGTRTITTHFDHEPKYIFTIKKQKQSEKEKLKEKSKDKKSTKQKKYWKWKEMGKKSFFESMVDSTAEGMVKIMIPKAKKHEKAKAKAKAKAHLKQKVGKSFIDKLLTIKTKEQKMQEEIKNLKKSQSERKTRIKLENELKRLKGIEKKYQDSQKMSKSKKYWKWNWNRGW